MAILNMHPKAIEVMRYMKELGMPEEIIARAYMQMYESKSWHNVPPSGHKVKLDEVIEAL